MRGSVWAPPVPLAATPGITFVFSSSPYLDVSVQGVPPARLWIQRAVHEVFSCGFPHSDTCGSSRMCRSPQLFAACRVFHRLPVPRHPSCALSGLTSHVLAVASARHAPPFFQGVLSALPSGIAGCLTICSLFLSRYLFSFNVQFSRYSIRYMIKPFGIYPFL